MSGIGSPAGALITTTGPSVDLTPRKEHPRMSAQTLDHRPALTRTVTAEVRRPVLRELVVVVLDALRAARQLRSAQTPAAQHAVAVAFARDLSR